MSSTPPPPPPYGNAANAYRTPGTLRTGRVVAIVLGLVLTSLLLIGGFVFWVFSTVRNSAATAAAVTAAARDQRVVAITGSPLTTGRFVSGHFSVQHSDSGDATLTIPVSGPSGKGNVYAVETRVHGTWVPTTLEFWPAAHPNDGIRLVEPSSAHPNGGSSE